MQSFAHSKVVVPKALCPKVPKLRQIQVDKKDNFKKVPNSYESLAWLER